MSVHAGITRPQKNCLDFIAAYCRRHGYSPTFDEIKEGIGAASKGSVFALINRLEARGWISRQSGCARSVVVLRNPAAERTALAQAWRQAGDAEKRIFLAAIGAPASCLRAEV
ncbi:MAG: hypothetical protein Kow0026_08500 [Oricola sp.]